MSCAAVAKDMGGAVIMHACVSKRLCEICNKITTMLVRLYYHNIYQQANILVYIAN